MRTWQMLKSMTELVEENWTNIIDLEGLEGESLWCLKGTWKHNWGLQTFIRINHKTFGTMLYWTRWDQSGVVWSECSAPFNKTPHSYFQAETEGCGADDFGTFSTHLTWPGYSAVIDLALNSSVHFRILEANVNLWQQGLVEIRSCSRLSTFKWFKIKNNLGFCNSLLLLFIFLLFL